MGQPGHPGHPRHRHAQAGDRLVGRAGHLRRVRRRVQRRDRGLRHRVRQRAAGRAARRPAHRAVDRRPPWPSSWRSPTRPVCCPPAPTWRRPTTSRRPTSSGRRSTPTAAPSTSCSARARARWTERAVYVDEIRDELRRRPPAASTARGVRGHPVGPGRGGRRPAREHRGQPDPAHLPGRRLFVFLFLAVRLRSVVRALLSMVPVLIAVGAVAGGLGASTSAQPHDRGGRPAGRRLCTEFTSLILLRFIEERQRGYPPREAVDVTAAGPGGPSSSRRSPPCRAWRSSPSRRRRCCATSA